MCPQHITIFLNCVLGGEDSRYSEDDRVLFPLLVVDHTRTVCGDTGFRVCVGRFAKRGGTEVEQRLDVSCCCPTALLIKFSFVQQSHKERKVW